MTIVFPPLLVYSRVCCFRYRFEGCFDERGRHFETTSLESVQFVRMLDYKARSRAHSKGGRDGLHFSGLILLSHSKRAGISEKFGMNFYGQGVGSTVDVPRKAIEDDYKV